MRLLLVFPEPLCVSLTIGRMGDWTQSRQEGWSLNLLKRPHHPLTYEGLSIPFPLSALEAPASLRS